MCCELPSQNFEQEFRETVRRGIFRSVRFRNEECSRLEDKHDVADLVNESFSVQNWTGKKWVIVQYVPPKRGTFNRYTYRNPKEDHNLILYSIF